MQGQLTLDLRTEQDILVPKTGRLVLLFLPQPYTSQHTQKAVLSPFFLLLSPPPLFNLSLSFQRELLSAPWRNKQTCPDWDEEEKKGEKHPILILALWTKLPLVSYQSGDPLLLLPHHSVLPHPHFLFVLWTWCSVFHQDGKCQSPFLLDLQHNIKTTMSCMAQAAAVPTYLLHSSCVPFCVLSRGLYTIVLLEATSYLCAISEFPPPSSISHSGVDRNVQILCEKLSMFWIMYSKCRTDVLDRIILQWRHIAKR